MERSQFAGVALPGRARGGGRGGANRNSTAAIWTPRRRYSRRIIERLLTQYESLGVAFDHDDLEYLLARVNQLPAAVH